MRRRRNSSHACAPKRASLDRRHNAGPVAHCEETPLKPALPLSITRRLFVTLSALLLAACAQLPPSGDALPSWNDGPARQAIVDFVRKTTDPASPQFVPPAERIATFDQDGTLWVEQPMYAQVMFALDRVKDVVKAKPALAAEEPFKTVLSGDRAAIARLGEAELFKIVVASQSGLTVEAYHQVVRDWLRGARHLKFQRPYTDLVYAPMLEVMKYLRANGFRTYIVTGGGQEFVRAFAEATYGAPPELVVGSLFKMEFAQREDKPALVNGDGVVFVNDKANKAIAINTHIGRRPQAAFGNSDGDREMLEWAAAPPGARLAMIVLHDDAVREYAYGPAAGQPASRIGTFTQPVYDQAKASGWTVISVKGDWKRVFAFE
jgi:phosphoserine phosphatase